MKKIFFLLLTLCIIVGSSIACFAEDYSNSGDVSALFKDTIIAVFSDSCSSTVIDYSGNDITEFFIDTFHDDFIENNFYDIWYFTKDNVSSIIIKEEVQPDIRFVALQSPGVTMANKTYNVRDYSNIYIDYNVESGGVLTHLEFAVVINGRYTQNQNTGKIVAASVRYLTLDYTNPGINWDIDDYDDFKNAVHSDYSATFMGTMHFTASYAGADRYISPKYSHQFTIRAD